VISDFRIGTSPSQRTTVLSPEYSSSDLVRLRLYELPNFACALVSWRTSNVEVLPCGRLAGEESLPLARRQVQYVERKFN
jgi:hypothetical protein